jgi:hypothetical protein
MKPGDLSESNAIKPVDYSNFLNNLIHALAVICGVVGYLGARIFVNFLASAFIIGSLGRHLIWGLVIFIIFLVLGAVFGFVWNKLGWKLGLSLASLVIIFWGFTFLLNLLNGINLGEVNFESTAIISMHTLLTLLGGCLGAYFGAKYKQKRLTNDSVV